MANVLITNQEKYVPKCSLADNEKKILQPVPLHGDQLFEERARNTKWTYQDGINQYDKLEGLQSEACHVRGKHQLLHAITMSITPLSVNPTGFCKEGCAPSDPLHAQTSF